MRLGRVLRTIGATVMLALTMPLAHATCGGGGGGGLGGMPVGQPPQAYRVPWQVLSAGAVPPAAPLVLYWFPTSRDEAERSSLLGSRALTLWASQCVALTLVPSDNGAVIARYELAGALPAAVLASSDGVEIARAGANGKLKLGDVEGLVRDELKRREAGLDEELDRGAELEKLGQSTEALEHYRGVWQERCLFPSLGKKAAKALKRLGQPPADEQSLLEGPRPDTSEATAGRMVTWMNEGLSAERAGHYGEAAALYEKAHALDSADPVPLRFLGELERHHTGRWDRATAIFEALLAMPADPLSRAVALHGLGKMTIHAGALARGVALIEQSVATYPLALAYRNLAVYWNSEGDLTKAQGYVDRALAIDPDEPYNLVFAAVFMAESGHTDEALKVAAGHEGLLAASYNLAAIHALSGQREKALELLARHFHAYERFDAVRAHEMKEAREDAVFATLHDDPSFVALTAGAARASPR